MAKKKNLQTDILETLSTYTKRVEKYATSFGSKKLIISTDVKVRSLKEDRGVQKTPLVWPLWDYKLFYMVDVPPGAALPSHSHDESVFRLLISGSLTINGRKIDEPGTWYVVPAFTEYTISTKTGYRVLSGYTSVCRTGRQQALLAKRTAPKG